MTGSPPASLTQFAVSLCGRVFLARSVISRDGKSDCGQGGGAEQGRGAGVRGVPSAHLSQLRINRWRRVDGCVKV